MLPGGLAILYTLATHFGITALKPAKGALRQGVVIDLHERLAARRQSHGGDARDQSVASLQARFGVDTRQLHVGGDYAQAFGSGDGFTPEQRAKVGERMKERQAKMQERMQRMERDKPAR